MTTLKREDLEKDTSGQIESENDNCEKDNSELRTLPKWKTLKKDNYETG